MKKLKYEHLFDPIKIGNTIFKNRIFSAPQDYPGLTSKGFITEEAAYFYERKAMGGFSSVCVGDMIVDGDFGRSHPFQMRGNDFLGKVNLTRASTAINRHGSISSIELCHAGKNANIYLMKENRGFVYGPSDGIREDGVEIRAMNEEQIEELIQYYADSAVFARQCGFKMLDLHGGHGWQISQFISARDNKRTDRWGGSLENRMRFPLAVVDAIRKRVGNSMVIEFRMSASECLPEGYEIDQGIEIAKKLDGKVDLIHVSVGHHEIDSSSMITMPSMFLEDGCNVKYAAEIKKHVETPIVTVGALTNPDMMEEIIASKKADIVALGRETLADPDLPIKARMGKENEINPCIRCFNCFSTSSIGGVFYCSTNPEIGREQEAMTKQQPKHKKKVLIAGGGIAGMQSALTAFDRGHEVILCEKTDKLGGTLLCEEKVPFKSNLALYIKRQSEKILKSGIELHLNTEVTNELCEKINPDVIIAALGARPVIPNIDGINNKNVYGAEEVYFNPELAGKKAVIIGGGLVGLELGLFLAKKGHAIDVIEISNGTVATPPPVTGTSARMSGIMEMPGGFPLVHGIAIKEEVKKYNNLDIHTSTKVLKITEDGVVVEDKDGIRTIEADTVIYAVGQKPLSEEACSLSKCVEEFHLIGDCASPRNIYSATSTAYQVAVDIGRY